KFRRDKVPIRSAVEAMLRQDYDLYLTMELESLKVQLAALKSSGKVEKLDSFADDLIDLQDLAGHLIDYLFRGSPDNRRLNWVFAKLEEARRKVQGALRITEISPHVDELGPDGKPLKKAQPPAPGQTTPAVADPNVSTIVTQLAERTFQFLQQLKQLSEQ